MKNRVLMVVDDDPIDIRFVERAFRDTGERIEVRGITDAREASARIGQGEADLVLLDINMPRISGLEVLHDLAQMGRGSLPPIIVFSSSDSPRDIEAAYDKNATAYVVKPGSLDGYRNVANAISTFWVDTAELGPQ